MQKAQRTQRVQRYPNQLILMTGDDHNARIRALVDPAGGDDVVSIAAVLRRIVELGLPALEREKRRAAAPQWR